MPPQATLPAIGRALDAPFSRPAHPSPSEAGLRLEARSPREIASWGYVIGRDVGMVVAPLGWGEFAFVGPQSVDTEHLGGSPV